MEQLTREKEWIERDLQLKTEESQQVMKKKNQLEKELYTDMPTLNHNNRSSSSSSRSVMSYSDNNKIILLSFLQLSAIHMIAKGSREEQPHWVVRREEVELTEKVLGRGGWGEVKVAKFRLRVAKFLHDMIISE